MQKNSLIPTCYSFPSTTKYNEVIAENRFRTVASPPSAFSFLIKHRPIVVFQFDKICNTA